MFLAVILAIVIIFIGSLWNDGKALVNALKPKPVDHFTPFWQPILDNGDQMVTFINYRFANGYFADEFITYIDGSTYEVTVPLKEMFVGDVKTAETYQAMAVAYESLTERQRNTASNEAKVMLLERALTDKSNKWRYNDEHGIVYSGVE